MAACYEIAQPLFVIVMECGIFCIRICWGTISKVLIMSVTTRTVWEGGVSWLNSPRICCCVSSVYSVVLVCLDLKHAVWVRRGCYV